MLCMLVVKSIKGIFVWQGTFCFVFRVKKESKKESEVKTETKEPLPAEEETEIDTQVEIVEPESADNIATENMDLDDKEWM